MARPAGRVLLGYHAAVAILDFHAGLLRHDEDPVARGRAEHWRAMADGMERALDAVMSAMTEDGRALYQALRRERRKIA